jgi:hypothetical protein
MAAISRILSYAVNKPYRSQDIRYEPHPYLNGDGYVDFAPGDIENPRNWSMARRVTITLTAILLVVNATFASSSPSGCFLSIHSTFSVILMTQLGWRVSLAESLETGHGDVAVIEETKFKAIDDQSAHELCLRHGFKFFIVLTGPTPCQTGRLPPNIIHLSQPYVWTFLFAESID